MGGGRCGLGAPHGGSLGARWPFPVPVRGDRCSQSLAPGAPPASLSVGAACWGWRAHRAMSRTLHAPCLLQLFAGSKCPQSKPPVVQALFSFLWSIVFASFWSLVGLRSLVCPLPVVSRLLQGRRGWDPAPSALVLASGLVAAHPAGVPSLGASRISGQPHWASPSTASEVPQLTQLHVPSELSPTGSGWGRLCGALDAGGEQLPVFLLCHCPPGPPQPWAWLVLLSASLTLPWLPSWHPVPLPGSVVVSGLSRTHALEDFSQSLPLGWPGFLQRSRSVWPASPAAAPGLPGTAMLSSRARAWAPASASTCRACRTSWG